MRLDLLTLAAVGATAQAAPTIWISNYPSLNTTSPLNAKCGEGLESLILQAVGLNQTISSLPTLPFSGALLEPKPGVMELWETLRSTLLAADKQKRDAAAVASPPSCTTEESHASHGPAVTKLFLDSLALGVGASTRGILPEQTSAELAPLLLYLMSPTWNQWLVSALGRGHGIPLNWQYKADANMIEAFAAASTYAHEHDTDIWRRLCSIQNLIAAVIACSSTDSFNQTACSTNLPTITLPDTCSYNGTSINFKDPQYVADPFFRDARVDTGETPRRFDKIDDTERVQLFQLFRAQRSLSFFTDSYGCGNSDYGAPLPGWNVTDVLTYNQPGSQIQEQKSRPDAPIFAVARPLSANANATQQCDVLLLTRGTMNTFEWGLDIDLGMTSLPGNRGGHGHRGFNRLVTMAYPQVQEVLNRIQTETRCQALRIMVTGHSLGGGVANALAYRLAVTYPQHFVNVAAFASPNVFDKTAGDNFAKLVNSRGIYSNADPVARAPVAVEMSPYKFPTCNLILDLPARQYLEAHETPGLHSIDIREIMGASLKIPESWLELVIVTGNGTVTNPFPNIPEADWIQITISLSGTKVLSEGTSKLQSFLSAVGVHPEEFVDQRSAAIAAKVVGEGLRRLGNKEATWSIQPRDISPRLDTSAPGLYIFLKMDLPLAIQTGLAHNCAYECWGALACESDATKLTECTACSGYSPPIHLLLALTF